MDEQEELRRRAGELLSRALSDLPSPINDYRLPPPDVAGILADHQIRKPQLDEIAREVDENWPGVCAVSAGHYSSDNQTFFSIQIEPFSKELQRQHWALADRIRLIVKTDKLSYFFLPKMDPFFSDVLVYRRESS